MHNLSNVTFEEIQFNVILSWYTSIWFMIYSAVYLNLAYMHAILFE